MARKREEGHMLHVNIQFHFNVSIRIPGLFPWIHADYRGFCSRAVSLADRSIEETPGLTAGRRWDVARQDAKGANVIHIHAEQLAFVFKSWACGRTFILLVTVT